MDEGPLLLRTSEDANWVEQAVAHLAAGGVLALPTETVYGLACSPLSSAGVTRLYALKGRDADKPLPLQVDSVPAAVQAGFAFSSQARRLAERFWPGPLTLVLPRPDYLPPEFAPGSTSVALRIPDHPITLRLLRRLNTPLAVTSANLSGEPPLTEAQEVSRLFHNEGALLVLDGGPTRDKVASTVVEATGTEPKLLREGPIPFAEILDVWNR